MEEQDQEKKVEEAVEDLGQETKNGSIVYRIRGDKHPRNPGIAIAKGFYEGKNIEIHAIGELANNQCVKALAIAINWLAGRGTYVGVDIFFGDTEHNQKQTTATVMCYRLFRK